MPFIHPETKVMLDRAAQSTEPPLETLSPQEARRLSDTRVANGPLPKPDMAQVRDITIPGPAGELRLRLYRPASDTPLPYAMFFHGGGFMLGTLETHDALCRQFASRSGVALVAVEFRLAPEHPSPAAQDDCLAATRWVAEHAGDLGLNPAHFAVVGESSGGNLAAAVALRLRDGGPAPAMQLLLYPAVDLTLTGPGYAELGEGYLLTNGRMRHYVSNYLGPDGDPRDPLHSPLFDPHPELTPPTYLLTAGLDPTTADAQAYGARLRAAGVTVDDVHFEGWTHGFLFWGHEDGSLAALASAAAALARALN